MKNKIRRMHIFIKQEILNKKGFHIIEMMIGLGIVATLAILIIPDLNSAVSSTLSKAVGKVNDISVLGE